MPTIIKRNTFQLHVRSVRRPIKIVLFLTLTCAALSLDTLAKSCTRKRQRPLGSLPLCRKFFQKSPQQLLRNYALTITAHDICLGFVVQLSCAVKRKRILPKVMDGPRRKKKTQLLVFVSSDHQKDFQIFYWSIRRRVGGEFVMTYVFAPFGARDGIQC